MAKAIVLREHGNSNVLKLEDIEIKKPKKRIYFYWNSDPEKRQPHSELDIYSTIQKDIYSIFSGYDAQKNIGYFKIMINPLVNWVWIGGVLMVIGSLFAFWPSRRDN